MCIRDSPDVDKVLYGKHAKNVMKTDVKETDNSYEVDLDLQMCIRDSLTSRCIWKFVHGISER